jgi:two-component system cell cycle response regulator
LRSSTFETTIDVMRPEMPSIIDADRASVARTDRARLLVVDEERSRRDALADLCRRGGHLVDTTPTAQEALERVALGGLDAVLIGGLTDKMSAIDCCRLVKSTRATDEGFLPVLLVSQRDGPQARVDALKSGADDCISEPYDDAELLARLAVLLRIRRMFYDVLSQRDRFERNNNLDELTGLYNSRYLSLRLLEEYRRSERYKEPFACMLVDIDELSGINQRRGRTAADSVVRAVAGAIRRAVRDVDLVARWSDGLFVIILPSTHFAGSASCAERIWREAKTSSTKIGISLYPSREARTRDGVLRAAERALAQAKTAGKDRICIVQQQGYVFSPTNVRVSRELP